MAACRPGVKLVPFYDRTTLVSVTTSTVLHNLIFGCLLIFFIQWIFLGDLRSAIIVGANIPFALVLQHHHPGAARGGRQPAVGRRGRFRHHCRCRGHPGREHLPEFPVEAGGTAALLHSLPRSAGVPIRHARLRFGRQARPGPIGCGLILISALQIDRAVFFSTAIIVAAFIPLFTMQGRRGPDLQPDGAHLRLCA